MVGIHLFSSNFLARSTAENLNASHPIRRMLRPHTYGAVSVNLGAINLLVPERGVLHRSVALTWNSLQRAYYESLQKIDRRFDMYKSFKQYGSVWNVFVVCVRVSLCVCCGKMFIACLWIRV